MDIEKRELKLGDNKVDKESCFSVCTWTDSSSKCSNITVTNSTTAGCPFAGFVVRGHACG